MLLIINIKELILSIIELAAIVKVNHNKAQKMEKGLIDFYFMEELVLNNQYQS